MAPRRRRKRGADGHLVDSEFDRSDAPVRGIPVSRPAEEEGVDHEYDEDIAHAIDCPGKGCSCGED